MISDVMAEAIQEVKYYLANFPKVYADAQLMQQIAVTVEVMEALRRRLDQAPGFEHQEALKP